MGKGESYLDLAQDALNRMRRANRRGTGCHLTAAMIDALSLTIFAEIWNQDDPRKQGGIAMTLDDLKDAFVRVGTEKGYTGSLNVTEGLSAVLDALEASVAEASGSGQTARRWREQFKAKA